MRKYNTAIWNGKVQGSPFQMVVFMLSLGMKKIDIL